MQPVEYLPSARRDFDESFDWYAARSVRTAVRFAGAVDVTLDKIARNPTRFASSDGVHRECPITKFPYRIVYRIVEGRVLVVAIAHAKRQPDYWKRP